MGGIDSGMQGTVSPCLFSKMRENRKLQAAVCKGHHLQASTLLPGGGESRRGLDQSQNRRLSHWQKEKNHLDPLWLIPERPGSR